MKVDPGKSKKLLEDSNMRFSTESKKASTATIEEKFKAQNSLLAL